MLPFFFHSCTNRVAFAWISIDLCKIWQIVTTVLENNVSRLHHAVIWDFMYFSYPGVNRVRTQTYWNFAMSCMGSSRVLIWQSKPRAAVATCVDGIFWATCPPTLKTQCIGPLKIICRKRFSGAFWTNNRAWQRFRRPQICRNWHKKNKTPYWGQILAGLQFLCGGLE